MSEQPGWKHQTNTATDDELSRRHLVTGVAAIAAFGGAAASDAAGERAAAADAPSHLRFLNPPTSFKNPGFTHGVEATLPGRALYLAGQQGLDGNDKLVADDFRGQVEQAFLNIKAILASAGGGFEHVVKLTHYMLDLRANYRMIRDVRAKYFDPSRPPASTMLQVGALTHEALYEVDVVAVLPPV